jgi:hypothetical protein
MSRVSSGAESAVYVASTKLTFNPSTGTLGSTVFNSTSDFYQKKNITRINWGLNVVNALSGVEFEWKDNDEKSAGVIAQELETYLPHLVTTGDDGMKSVNYDGIIGYLIEAVKELSSKVDALQK